MLINVKNEYESPSLIDMISVRYIYENSIENAPLNGPPLHCFDPDPFETITWYIPLHGSVASTSLNPCGLTAARQCSQWPREYLKVPTSSLSEDQYSSILVVGVDGAKKIDYEKERSFSIRVGVRDGFALTATGTLNVQVLNVNERPIFRSAINKTVYFLSHPGSRVGTPIQYQVEDPEDGTLAFTFACSMVNWCYRQKSQLSSIFYTEVSQVDLFRIDFTTGQIYVKNTAEISGGEEFHFVIRVEDSEGAFCHSNDESCGGDESAVTLISVENNTAPVLDDISEDIKENLLELEKVIVLCYCGEGYVETFCVSVKCC